MRVVSTQTKVEQVHSLLGTTDLNAWESGFVRGLYKRCIVEGGELSEPRLDRLDELWRKHFA